VTRFLARTFPWAGLVIGAGAWAAHQQGMADLLHFSCHPAHGVHTVGVGVVALLATVGGGLMSWRTSMARDDPTATRRFVSRLSVMAAAIFAGAIVMQTLAGIIVPACRS